MKACSVLHVYSATMGDDTGNVASATMGDDASAYKNKRKDCDSDVKDGAKNGTRLLMSGLVKGEPQYSCMGQYDKQTDTNDGKSTYKGGMPHYGYYFHPGNRRVWYDKRTNTWNIAARISADACKRQQTRRWNARSLYVKANDATTPDQVTETWYVYAGYEQSCDLKVTADPASEGIRLSGLEAHSVVSKCMGFYQKQPSMRGDVAWYKGVETHNKGCAIWYGPSDYGSSHSCWYVGDAYYLGTGDDWPRCGYGDLDAADTCYIYSDSGVRPTTPDKVPDQACDAGWWYVSEGWKPNKDIKCTAILSSKIARTEPPQNK